ncbi:MAG: 50S ribosomal protein L18 [Bacteroidetes bacterium]|nr:MAG: 50S ribosomal protein L18 [Bacteroidota bacterium]
MAKSAKKLLKRNRIRKRIRNKIRGSAERPRLSVYRSNKEIYAQIIDDDQGVTLASCSSRIKDVSSQPLSKTERSKLVGQKLAEIAKAKGIESVVFDRGGYKFHGRVKALATGAREGGLNF